MKKVLLILCVIAAVLFMLDGEPKKVTYSESEMREAIEEAEYYAYKEGYERGYDEGDYYARGGLIGEEDLDYAYEAGLERGYEVGYDEGYDDCLEEHGLVEEPTFDPDNLPRIKKDK